jgi:hypothetical protein
MNSYHLLFLDGDKVVQLAQGLLSENDTHAIADASERAAGRDAELWEGNRLVQRLEPRQS